MTAGTVRERRRADTMREIKESALAQLAAAGTGGLSLRGVAREVGMTVQSIYHYFASRDELLTALVTDAHGALADAVQTAAEASRGRPRAERLSAVTGAYRQWALEHRSRFLLLYGTPVPGYQAPPDGETTVAAQRLATGFLDAVFDGWTRAQLESIPLPGVDPGALGPDDLQAWSLPAGAVTLFLDLRARMHGAVILEVLDQLHPFGDHADTLFAAMTARMADELDALQRCAARR